MHVLSLPPAFVLSQDQTLKLRIQSLALRHVTESTRTHTRLKRPESLKNEVLSLDKRDRQSLFQGQSFQTVRDTPPPTFLFLLDLQLSKNRRKLSRLNQSPKAQRRIQLITGSSTPHPSETSERVRRSPAAPPPSLVSRFLRPHTKQVNRDFSKLSQKVHFRDRSGNHFRRTVHWSNCGDNGKRPA